MKSNLDFSFLTASPPSEREVDNIVDINHLFSQEMSDYFIQKTLNNPLLRQHNTLISAANYLLYVLNHATSVNITLCNQDGLVLINHRKTKKLGSMCYLALYKKLVFFSKLRSGRPVCTQITGVSEEFGRQNVDAYVVAYPILDSHAQFIGYITGEVDSREEIAYCEGIISFLAQVISENNQILEKQIACRTLVMNNIPSCSLVIDKSGSVLESNNSFEQFLRNNDLDLNSTNFLNLLHDKDAIVETMEENNVLASTENPLEFQVMVPKGVYQCRMLSCKNLSKGYGQPGWFVSFGLMSFVPIKTDGTISFASMESHFGHLHSCYEHFNRILNLCEQVAPKKINVLIQGESGTGKDVMARAIHQASMVTGPFVALNCGAIEPSLLLSELFGYDDGAFTGARKGGKIGKLEAANHGTIFLDEIGEMPLESQVSLLKFLDNQMIVKLGGTTQHPVDVRIIAATNRDLATQVKEGHFREDLYYRLNVMDIYLPPLRDRVDDIPDICQNILMDLSKKHSLPTRLTLEKNCEFILKQYNWPGNIRELKNVLELAFALTDGDHICFPVLQEVMHQKCFKTQAPSPQVLNEAQRLELALAKYNGNISAVAKDLNLSRTTVYKKIDEYQLR